MWKTLFAGAALISIGFVAGLNFSNHQRQFAPVDHPVQVEISNANESPIQSASGRSNAVNLLTAHSTSSPNRSVPSIRDEEGGKAISAPVLAKGESEALLQETERLVDTAIQQGVWTPHDALELRNLMTKADADTRDRVLQKFLEAQSSQKFRAVAMPPF